MTPVERITSLQNPRVKRLIKLRERRHREREGVVLLDELRVIRRALDADVAFREAFVCPELPGGDGDLVGALRSAGADVTELAPHVMAKAAYRGDPAGVLALAEPPARTLDALDLPDDTLVLVLENVEKPGNLGAVVRTASGASVDAVLACGAGADPWNPNALRASTGTVFTVPVIAAEPDALVAALRDQGLRLLATTPDAGDLYTDLDLTGPVAFLLGAEDQGLSVGMQAAADTVCRIPMNGAADSRNVRVSGAILVYEALRQRA